MRDVVVLGVGMHKFGRFPDKDFALLARDAAKNALADAGVTWKDIEALYASSFYFGAGWGNAMAAQLGMTGIPIFNIESACCSGAAAFLAAYHAVAGGAYDLVCVCGAEKQPRGLIPLRRYPLWQRRSGMVAGAAFHAFEAQRHMFEFGTTMEGFAAVAVKSHKNAALCEYAHYRDNANLTVEEVVRARVICQPLTIYMLCPPSEGAAAAIVCTPEVARRYQRGPFVTVAGAAGCSGRYDLTQIALGSNDPSLAGIASKKAYEMAGLGPEDLDIVEVEDAAVSSEICKVEELGLCERGGGARLIASGATDIGGRIPVNTDGGHVSRGNPMGAAALAEIAEVTWQLRGEAGQRQVANAKVGLVEAFGDGPNEVVAILKR